MPELTEIKALRKRLELTQAQLSKLAGVSQSLIAKIEAGNIDPTYTKARKILDALHSFGQKSETKAKDIMCTKIISARAGESVSSVIKKMRSSGISQMPVYSQKNIVGFISENTILDSIADGRKDISSLRAEDLMEEVPPTLPEDTPANVVAGLLRHYPIVLITSHGDVKGVVSKTDILTGLYEQ